LRIGLNALYLVPGAVGGTETYLRNLLRALQQIDHEDQFTLFTNAENAGTFELQAANFREVRCAVWAASAPRRILWEQLLLPRAVRRARLDVLHSPGYTAPLRMAAASVVTIHDVNYHFFPEDWPRATRWGNRLLIPRVARSADRILTDSRSSERAIAQVLRVPAERIDVVQLGVDGNLPPPCEEARVRARLGIEGRYLLSVTAAHPHKNVDGLLRAYQRACRGWPSPPPLVLVATHGRHQARLRAHVLGWRGPGRVVLSGWLEPRELSSLYRGAHLFAFASRYEGFGFPPLEAMASGVPVVSSNAAALAEVLGDAGLTFDPTDEAAMAAAIRRGWDDERLRADLVARGRAHAATFTWRRTAERTLAAYRRAALDRAR
jgi:glycosyltransferase involved in cell wall biosynthesis